MPEKIFHTKKSFGLNKGLTGYITTSGIAITISNKKSGNDIWRWRVYITGMAVLQRYGEMNVFPAGVEEH